MSRKTITYYRSDAPLYEALRAITGKRCKCVNLLGIKNSNELSSENQNALYEWCTQNARPHWSTGLGILEAAELIVDRAIENANI